MEEKKVTNPGLLRLRRSIELREYALAAFYPLTHSGISAHHKRAVDRVPAVPAHPLLSALRDNYRPPDSEAELCREAVARSAVTPQVEEPQRLEREHGFQRLDGPKPWKKPWDK
jgi:hypothetical protein